MHMQITELLGSRRDAVDENEDIDLLIKSRDSFRLGLFCFAGNMILRLKFTRADHRGDVVGLTGLRNNRILRDQPRVTTK
jgi:hypothetical protein